MEIAVYVGLGVVVYYILRQETGGPVIDTVKGWFNSAEKQMIQQRQADVLARSSDPLNPGSDEAIKDDQAIADRTHQNELDRLNKKYSGVSEYHDSLRAKGTKFRSEDTATGVRTIPRATDDGQPGEGDPYAGDGTIDGSGYNADGTYKGF